MNTENHPSTPRPILPRHSLLRSTLMLITGFFIAGAPQPANAKPRASKINIIPSITGITVKDGQLVTSGNATATIKGATTTVPFTDVPVDISLAADQTGADATCPILDLQLGPINLDLLGLVVETSPICLTIDAHEGGGLLGDLLCSVANLLDGGLSLTDILAGNSLVDPVTGLVTVPGLSPADVTGLLGGLDDLLNGALQNLLNAVITAIEVIQGQNSCAILHLELGPLNLTLLGLQVVLDDCDGGPVVVDITGARGPGKLLGNILCGLLNPRGPGLGATLQNLLTAILGRL